MKAVIDTNVFVSSLINARGIPRRIIDLWKTGEITLCVSKEILEEYIEVIVRVFPDDPEPDELLTLFGKRANMIFAASLPKINAVKDDPSDDKFIECAVAAGAGYIISGDIHLRNLKSYSGIKIVSPAEFLSR
ncbi:MAG: putative toxin-antitoxin system toxin component, PIN family [Thermodesulfovibrionales bacterium]|nr:putative toxin-antitoxin system toxin component, PIN family [Thermodesulfovibrionales bacterium]